LRHDLGVGAEDAVYDQGRQALGEQLLPRGLRRDLLEAQRVVGTPLLLHRKFIRR
jgi:hypothetical protein